MIAAIYARKSTVQERDEKEKSVARQVEHARAYAEKKGWTVADEHVYVDDGISGAEFEKRPGFVRLMNALKPRAPFDALVMSEESRLGREAIETSYHMKQLVQAGVRVFFYLDDREQILGSMSDNTMAFLRAEFAAEERRKASQRTHDALLRKFLAGHVAGGSVFGYDNVQMFDSAGRHTHTIRRINDQQAAALVRLFELYATGYGKVTVARMLNDEGLPAPKPRVRRERSARFPTGWAPTSVQEALYRRLYQGDVLWNQTRKRDQWGQAVRSKRPDTEHLSRHDEALRIISEDLWKAAHARLAYARATYLRATKGQLNGKPLRGTASKYLLTGLLECGCCGGTLEVRSRANGRGRRFFYACATHRRRGRQQCAGIDAPMDRADDAVLAYFENQILTPDRLHRIYEAMLADPYGDDAEGRKAQLTARRAELSRQLIHLGDAIASGGGTLQALRDGIQAREREAEQIDRDLNGLNRPTLPRAKIVARLDALIAEWRPMLRGNPAQGRQLLRKMIEPHTRLVFVPECRDEQPGYRVLGQPTDAALIAVAATEDGAHMVASPTGFEPVFWP